MKVVMYMVMTINGLIAKDDSSDFLTEEEEEVASKEKFI